MNRKVRNALAVGIAWVGLMATLASRPAAAADDAVVTADKAVMAFPLGIKAIGSCRGGHQNPRTQVRKECCLDPMESG